MAEDNKLSLLNTDQLVVRDTKELGAALTQEAIVRAQKQREELVIKEVQRIETCRLDYARQAVFATQASNWYARKLDAVNNGQFKLNVVTGEMIFDNLEFNRANF